MSLYLGMVGEMTECLRREEIQVWKGSSLTGPILLYKIPGAIHVDFWVEVQHNVTVRQTLAKRLW